MNFESELIKKAKKCKKSIVFPEIEYSDRIVSAVKKLIFHKICKVILLGNRTELSKTFKENANVLIIDPKNYSNIDEMAKLLFKAREHKGMTIEQANQLITNEIYFGIMLVKTGLADGMVCGAENKSVDVIRPALQLLRKDNQFVSSCVILSKKNKQPLIFADCALNTYPNVQELTDITINSANFAKFVCNINPIVALLSFSTNGSGKGESVDKMLEVKAKLKQKKVHFKYFGETQFDAAIDSAVATRKKINSEYGGMANVFIFPEIDAGNIGYKIAHELGGYNAIGPVTLNLDKPVNDLSRGCKVEDIILTTCVTILQTKN